MFVTLFVCSGRGAGEARLADTPAGVAVGVTSTLPARRRKSHRWRVGVLAGVFGFCLNVAQKLQRTASDKPDPASV